MYLEQRPLQRPQPEAENKAHDGLFMAAYDTAVQYPKTTLLVGALVGGALLSRTPLFTPAASRLAQASESVARTAGESPALSQAGTSFRAGEDVGALASNSVIDSSLRPGFIHPTARIHSTALINPEARIGANVEIGQNATIGAADLADGVIVGMGAQIERGVVVGAGSKIGDEATLLGKTVVGKDVQIGDGAFTEYEAMVGDNSFLGKSTYISRGTRIGSNAFIGEKTKVGATLAEPGQEAIIGDGVRIGKNSRIGSASIGSLSTFDSGVQIKDGVKIGTNAIFGKEVFVGQGVSIGDRSFLGHRVVLDNLTSLGSDVSIGSRSRVWGVHLGDGTTADVATHLTKA